MDWKTALNGLMDRIENTLILDREFMNHAFDPSEIDSLPMSPKEILALLAGEAEKTLAMIAPHLRPGMRMLEVGGGVGLVYAVLRSRGFDVVSLEPGAEGFGDRHRAGLRMLELLGIDAGGWLRLGIEDFDSPGQSLDLIFSYFVLEHVPDLDRAFQVMAGVLHPDGVMVHQCPNYTVPFEPHYNIPLIPFRPEFTPMLFPGLRHRGLWRGLRFTTVGCIARLCARHGLRPVFRKGMIAEAFERVLDDPLFRARKQGFANIARLLKASGILKALRHLPPVLDSPMEFTARKM
jgi:SAM-dependent methyltransferase